MQSWGARARAQENQQIHASNLIQSLPSIRVAHHALAYEKENE
jgi:hypothetical protein